MLILQKPQRCSKKIMYEIYNDIEIEKIVAGGDGLARVDGRVIFVPFVLPGEIVSVKIIKEKKDYLIAELLDIKNKSVSRKEPVCKWYGTCGGCNFQHIKYNEQIEQKNRIIEDTFKRICKIDLSIKKNILSKEYFYRNRAQFHLDKNGSIGFKEKGSDTIIDLNKCPVCVETVNNFLLKKSEIKNKWKERFLIFGDENKYYFDDKNSSIISLDLLDKKITFPLKSFFQSNLSILPSVINQIVNDISGETVLDLYSGIGLFGCFFNKFFKRVIFVEENIESAKFARKNVSHGNNLFFSTSVEKWVQGAGKKYFADTIFIDPPRTGLSKKIREYIINKKPENILYLSCNPVTMARDVKEFINIGWKIKKSLLFDFFPQTSHIELFLKLKLE